MRNVLTATATSAAALFAFACGGNQGQRAEPPPRAAQETPGEPGAEDQGDQQLEAAMIDLSNWKSWQNVSKERVLSEAHGNMWVEVYVPAPYADDYVQGTAPAPEGMQIVMAQYPSQDSQEPESLAVMVKMRDDYDPEHQNWFYGVYAPSGDKAMQQGKLESCMGCHTEAGPDYLYRNLP